MSSDALFRPFKLKGLNLPNRVVLAPMTRSFSPGGIPSEDVAQYYRRRAEGAVGFIISEGTGVDRPASLNDPNVPRFHGEKELAGWRRVVDEVHAAGGLMAPQLWHVGAVRTRAQNWSPPGAYDSPSGLSRLEKIRLAHWKPGSNLWSTRASTFCIARNGASGSRSSIAPI